MENFCFYIDNIESTIIKNSDSIVKCNARCCNHLSLTPDNSCDKSTTKWIKAARNPISREKNNNESSIRWKTDSMPSWTIHNLILDFILLRSKPANSM